MRIKPVDGEKNDSQSEERDNQDLILEKLSETREQFRRLNESI